MLSVSEHILSLLDHKLENRLHFLHMNNSPFKTAFIFIILLELLSFLPVAFADRGDTLIITGNTVNLRSRPSASADVIKQLGQKSKVIEISRFEEWVEVTTDESRHDYGWIHQSLLSSFEGKSLAHPENSQFELFKVRYMPLLRGYEDESGIELFSAIELIDTGSVQLIATDDWFGLEQQQRDKYLTEVFDFWRKFVETGKSVSVEIIDSSGEQHMMMFK